MQLAPLNKLLARSLGRGRVRVEVAGKFGSFFDYFEYKKVADQY